MCSHVAPRGGGRFEGREPEGATDRRRGRGRGFTHALARPSALVAIRGCPPAADSRLDRRAEAERARCHTCSLRDGSRPEDTTAHSAEHSR